jgi:quercetin dioxygenase-like cupin family protein
MLVIDSDKVKAEKVQTEGAKDTTIQILINHPPAPTFVMRKFRIKPGGYTPLHAHDYEHEVYVLEGLGEVGDKQQSIPIKQGSVVFIPPNEVHQFRNVGEGDLVFLCLVPA